MTSLRRSARRGKRAGLAAVMEILRRARWHAAFVWPSLRPRQAARLTALWLREPAGRRAYRVLSPDDLLASRRSEVAFVFGSGRSLVDIGDEEWRRIAAHDTVAFSHFHRQRWIRVDYHLVAEVASTRETASSIEANPRYADTIFGLMQGWLAEASNDVVAHRLLPAGSRMFRWRRVSRGRTGPPSTRLQDGLVHGAGTIQDVVNFALAMGWRRIVIAGVDLYNKEYFWLPAGVGREDEDPGVDAASPWAQADPIVEALGSWASIASCNGVSIEVYDPRSLLARALPVFEW